MMIFENFLTRQVTLVTLIMRFDINQESRHLRSNSTSLSRMFFVEFFCISTIFPLNLIVKVFWERFFSSFKPNIKHNRQIYFLVWVPVALALPFLILRRQMWAKYFTSHTSIRNRFAELYLFGFVRLFTPKIRTPYTYLAKKCVSN